MKEWMDLVDYRITEGSDYGWQCYGSNAYMMDSWNGEQDGHSFTVIFDTKDQTVYEVQAHDYVHNRAYRMINEDFQKKMKKNLSVVMLTETKLGTMSAMWIWMLMTIFSKKHWLSRQVKTMTPVCLCPLT